jgi:hypothetical protein
MAGLSLHAIQSSAIAITRLNSFGQIDLVRDRVLTLQPRDPLDLRRAESSCPRMSEIELLVEAYLTAERDLVAAVDTAGGAVPLTDGRTVTVTQRIRPHVDPQAISGLRWAFERPDSRCLYTGQLPSRDCRPVAFVAGVSFRLFSTEPARFGFAWKSSSLFKHLKIWPTEPSAGDLSATKTN